MTNLTKFKNKFQIKPSIEYIKDMFRYANIFSEETIETLIKGLYTSFDADAAVAVAHEAISFYIETGWWPIGLDKADVKTNKFKPLQTNQFYVKGEHGDVIFGCTERDGKPNWHYTAAILKPQTFNTLLELLYDEDSPLIFDGVEFEFEDIQLTGSNFSLVSIYDLAKV